MGTPGETLRDRMNVRHATRRSDAISLEDRPHTGDRLRERPCLGSWAAYDLGTENEDLPGFIRLNTSKSSTDSSAFLPSIYSGTPIGVNGEDMSRATIADVQDDRLPIDAKRRPLDFVQRLNERHLESRPGDQERRR